MNSHDQKVLAVAAFTKRFGTAVFYGKDLRFFAVQTFSSPKTARLIKEQTSLKFREMIQNHTPGLILVKGLTKRQILSPNLISAFDQIKKEAKFAGIPIKEVSLDIANRWLCAGRDPTKENTFAALEYIYPELGKFINPENISQTEYYNSLLSAVAIGVYRQMRRAKPDLNKTYEK